MPFDGFPVPPADIDRLFLTHAHIDHIGRVPDLIDAGFSREIICTHGTKALKTTGSHPIQFIDLAAQQKKIRKNIEQRITRVLSHGKYIMAPR